VLCNYAGIGKRMLEEKCLKLRPSDQEASLRRRNVVARQMAVFNIYSQIIT
jgi:hypothetical protein